MEREKECTYPIQEITLADKSVNNQVATRHINLEIILMALVLSSATNRAENVALSTRLL
jgi:hypothetical protein